MKVRIYPVGIDVTTWIEYRNICQAERFEPAGTRLSAIPSSAINRRLVIFNPDNVVAMVVEPDDEPDKA